MRGHRMSDLRGAAAGDDWPVLKDGLGRRCNIEGVSGHVPNKVGSGGAYRGGGVTVRWRGGADAIVFYH
jgi:hypothetical protein